MAEPVAWGEPFDGATAGLRFEGEGVRIDGLEIGKGGGQITGAIFVRWDGTYSFNIDGRDIAVDTDPDADQQPGTARGRSQLHGERGRGFGRSSV